MKNVLLLGLVCVFEGGRGNWWLEQAGVVGVAGDDVEQFLFLGELVLVERLELT